METGLHCQVFKFELVNAQTQSVYFPADLDLQSGRTIIKSWILHHLQPLVIGFISVMISFIFNFSRVFSFTDGSLERALIDLVYYWIIKCYINGCCLLFIQPKRWTLADPLFLTAIIEEGKEVKREIEVDGCVIQCPMFYWSLLCLSTSTVGWSKLDCFLLLWLTSAYCEQCFQTRRDIFSRLKWSFCLLALAFPFKMTKFAHCIWADRWRVLSETTYSALWQLCQRQTKREDDKWRFCHLSPGLAKQPSPVQAWNHVWREILYVREKKKNQVVLQSKCYEDTAVLCDSGRFWGTVFAECVAS